MRKTSVPRQTAARRFARRRRGVLSAEMIMVLPILIVVLSGLFEFAMLFSARRELNAAAAVGARKATMPGVSVEDIEAEVRRVLSPRLRPSLRIGVDPGQRSGDIVTVALATNMRNASPDLLWPIGYSLTNRQLYAAVRMVRE